MRKRDVAGGLRVSYAAILPMVGERFVSHEAALARPASLFLAIVVVIVIL